MGFLRLTSLILLLLLAAELHEDLLPRAAEAGVTVH